MVLYKNSPTTLIKVLQEIKEKKGTLEVGIYGGVISCLIMRNPRIVCGVGGGNNGIYLSACSHRVFFQIK